MLQRSGWRKAFSDALHAFQTPERMRDPPWSWGWPSARHFLNTAYRQQRTPYPANSLDAQTTLTFISNRSKVEPPRREFTFSQIEGGDNHGIY